MASAYADFFIGELFVPNKKNKLSKNQQRLFVYNAIVIIGVILKYFERLRFQVQPFKNSDTQIDP